LAAFLVTALVGAGCRPDGTTSPAPSAYTPDATVAPAEEYVTLPRSVYEVKREPPGWLRTRRGDWLVFESPDKTALVGFIGIEYTKGGARRLWFQPDALGISGDVWDSHDYRDTEVGPDHLPANVERGTCKLGSRDASLTLTIVHLPVPAKFAVSTSWPDLPKQALVVRVLRDDAPPDARLEADAAADSIRRKR
jgi:hypothetical protein